MDDDASTAWIAGGACVVAAALALGACAGSAATVCPAVGWGSTLIVEFADDWPDVPGGMRLECRPECVSAVLDDGSLEALESPAGSSLTVGYTLSTPNPVVLTVSAPDGSAVTEVEVDVEWRRVGGSEECGGPMEATVEVPAP